jgi:hypothetical protein
MATTKDPDKVRSDLLNRKIKEQQALIKLERDRVALQQEAAAAEGERRLTEIGLQEAQIATDLARTQAEGQKAMVGQQVEQETGVPAEDIIGPPPAAPPQGADVGMMAQSLIDIGMGPGVRGAQEGLASPEFIERLLTEKSPTFLSNLLGAPLGIVESLAELIPGVDFPSSLDIFGREPTASQQLGRVAGLQQVLGRGRQPGIALAGAALPSLIGAQSDIANITLQGQLGAFAPRVSAGQESFNREVSELAQAQLVRISKEANIPGSILDIVKRTDMDPQAQQLLLAEAIQTHADEKGMTVEQVLSNIKTQEQALETTAESIDPFGFAATQPGGPEQIAAVGQTRIRLQQIRQAAESLRVREEASEEAAKEVAAAEADRQLVDDQDIRRRMVSLEETSTAEPVRGGARRFRVLRDRLRFMANRLGLRGPLWGARTEGTIERQIKDLVLRIGGPGGTAVARPRSGILLGNRLGEATNDIIAMDAQVSQAIQSGDPRQLELVKQQLAAVLQKYGIEDSIFARPKT